MPAMFGPVSSQMRPARIASGGDRSQSLATNGVACSACSTTGWRPPSIDEVERAVDLRPHIVCARPRASASAAATSSTASASAAALIVVARGDHRGGEPLENLELEAERAVGGAGDLGFQLAELGGGEAHLAGQRLAVDEGRVQRRAPSACRRAARSPRRNSRARCCAGSSARARRSRRHSAPAAARSPCAIRRAARAPRRARRRSPSRTKPPSRLNSGSSSASAAASSSRSAWSGGAAPRRASAISAGASRQRVEPLRRAPRPPRCRRGWRRGRAGRRGRPRAATARAPGRARRCSSCADLAGAAAASATNASTASSRRAIASGSVSGAASRCASSREPAAVTVRSIAASSEPRRSPRERAHQFEIGARRLVDRKRRARASRTGGDSGGRLPSCVRST